MTPKSKTNTIPPFTISLNNLGIVEAIFDKDILEVSKIHLQVLRENLKALGAGKKLPLYVQSQEFIPLSIEARKYIAKPEASDYTLANAIHIDTLAKKLVFNFMLRFSSPSVPTRAFTNKEEALLWLLKIKNDFDSKKRNTSLTD